MAFRGAGSTGATGASSCASGFADGATGDRTAWVGGGPLGGPTPTCCSAAGDVDRFCQSSLRAGVAPLLRCTVIGEVCKGRGPISRGSGPFRLNYNAQGKREVEGEKVRGRTLAVVVGALAIIIVLLLLILFQLVSRPTVIEKEAPKDQKKDQQQPQKQQEATQK